ncbi:IS21-like element helper ATPase IstB [Streptomyces sp. CA-288835]|uniref:IS21-like element helper ATPase IstB n=1 Tax=Streptomyces sp. CA-288835 TaxID=3240069 RepID=UPI003D8F7061
MQVTRRRPLRPNASPPTTTLGYALFATRWLQAPLYFGLVAAQAVYVYKFFNELWSLILRILSGHATETYVMLAVLKLVDVVMIANLLIMVIIGGYETFVSRIGLEGHRDQPEWLSHVNANVLKVKLATAIVGISSVHLLQMFVDVHHTSRHSLMWGTVIHMAFILSAAILWYMSGAGGAAGAVAGHTGHDATPTDPAGQDHAAAQAHASQEPEPKPKPEPGPAPHPMPTPVSTPAVPASGVSVPTVLVPTVSLPAQSAATSPSAARPAVHSAFPSTAEPPAPYARTVTSPLASSMTLPGIETRIRDAGFPSLKLLEDFDDSHPRSFDRETVARLGKLDFVAARGNVVFVGPPGTGKTHLAVGLGVRACQAGYGVLFATAAEWAYRLTEARDRGRLAEELAILDSYPLLIIDEVGYAPFDAATSHLLFQLVAHRYERASLIVTSDRPLGRWEEIFGGAAPALVDRLAHHAEIVRLDGDSYRMRRAISSWAD